MKQLYVVCDFCNKRELTTWNGEFHLAPKGWGEIYDVDVFTMDLHVCPKCLPTKENKNGKKENKSPTGAKKA